MYQERNLARNVSFEPNTVGLQNSCECGTSYMLTVEEDLPRHGYSLSPQARDFSVAK